jgi:hypothetical protein
MIRLSNGGERLLSAPRHYAGSEAVDPTGCPCLGGTVNDTGVIPTLLSPASSVSIALSAARSALGLLAIVSSINVDWR